MTRIRTPVRSILSMVYSLSGHGIALSSVHITLNPKHALLISDVKVEADDDDAAASFNRRRSLSSRVWSAQQYFASSLANLCAAPAATSRSLFDVVSANFSTAITADNVTTGCMSKSSSWRVTTKMSSVKRTVPLCIVVCLFAVGW